MDFQICHLKISGKEKVFKELPSVQTSIAQTCPREWRPLGSKPKSSQGAPPPRYSPDGTGSGGDDPSNPSRGAHPGNGRPGSNSTTGGGPPGGGPPAVNPANGSKFLHPHWGGKALHTKMVSILVTSDVMYCIALHHIHFGLISMLQWIASYLYDSGPAGPELLHQMNSWQFS